MSRKMKVIPMACIGLLLVGFSVWRVYDAFGQEGAAGDSAMMPISNPEIDKINQDIANKKSALDLLKQKQDEYKRAIEEKQLEKADLVNQMAIFDNRIAAMEISIEDVKLNIEKAELEIKRFDFQIQEKEAQIEAQKSQIATALSLLYQTGNKTDLEIILLNDNLSSYIDQVQHLKDLDNGINDRLNQIKDMKKQLEQDRSDLASKRLSLKSLQEDLVSRLDDLQSEKESKQLVLDQTSQSESEYQRLLSLAKSEQQAAAADISGLESQIRMRLANSDKFKEVTESGQALIWPVTKNTITAYFHDPDYPFRNVMEHPAIDIRSAQSSPIKAAASGYVARVKNGSDGSYGYIMLVHANGYSTVYGHVSRIYVTEEQYISQGDVIGLSGGMPGTAGAGRMTTGPHLHFELRYNGIPINALEHLN